MENEDSPRKTPAVYSKTIRAGRRRTYFFDVRTTRGNDFYVTITESKKRFHEDGYDRHKVFLYKEDFHKFLDALNEVVSHVKTDLLPEYDFDEFSRNYDEGGDGSNDNFDDSDTRSDAGSSSEAKLKPEVKEEPKVPKEESAPPQIDDEELKM